MINNIRELTLNNTYYRKVINTTETQQLVVMNIPNKINIGSEIHPHTTQFIRIESGRGKVFLGNNNKEQTVKKDDFIIIPPGIKHDILSTSKNGLKLYTIYSPPEHKPNLKQKNKIN